MSLKSLRNALASGDPGEVERHIVAGGDLRYRDQNGYDALIDAVHGRDIGRDPRLLELLGLLVKHGVDLNGVSNYGESALRVLSRIGRFDGVRLLLEAGADPAPLGWTPLHEAVALGGAGEVGRLLEAGHPLEERDGWERTPWLLSIQTGDLSKAAMLKEAGADIHACARCGKPPLFHAIESHRAPMLRWLLESGHDPELTDGFGCTCLVTAAECDEPECLSILLEAGVEVDRLHNGSTALGVAVSRGAALALLEAGADPAGLSNEGRRVLAGLPAEADEGFLRSLPKNQFTRARTRRFGRSNPEEMREPFWEAMVRAGVSAYAADECFGGDGRSSGTPVWCAQRFGQSLTILPDGRIVLIGGEHEDFYDPDFCIYNDVIVHDPDGGIRIFGYPESVFPPTDFHSATLLGDRIFLIGSLGYPSRRGSRTPVYRLDPATFRMEEVPTTGESPGWIHRHRAIPVGKGEILIRGGTILTPIDGKETRMESRSDFLFDVESGNWRKV